MPEAIYLIAIFTYTLRVLFFVVGSILERRKSVSATDATPFVTVIVPARNEEMNIVPCLESLIALDYPADRMELIVVNDRSTDSTAAVLTMQKQRFANLRIVTINDDGDKNLRGKAGALDKGIEIAKGEIILLTDADCEVHPGWVKSHTAQYAEPSVSMVCAYTLINGKTLFHKMQSVEWNSTHTMASAGVYFKQYLGCYGNNMSFRKSAYDAVGGYRSIPFSVTEDLALLQVLGKHKFTIRYLCSIESSVTTYPLNTLREYLAQHKRWTIGAQQLGIRAVVFVLSSAALWTGLITSLILLDWVWFAVILIVRVAEDFVINYPSLRILKRNHLLIYNIPAVLFFTLLELVLPLFLIDQTIRWKGQSFKG